MYSDVYLLYRLTQILLGQNFEIYYFGGFGTFPTIFLGNENLGGYFGFAIFDRYVLPVGVSFQNKALLLNIFSMYSLIKSNSAYKQIFLAVKDYLVKSKRFEVNNN